MNRAFAAALATSTCVVALATPAAAQTREYNIPAGSLKSALDTYVRQSGRQIVYRADQVRSARSHGARGKQSAEAALAAILAGSGFTTRVDGNLVAIVRGGNAEAASSAASRKNVPAAGAATEAENAGDIIVTGSRLKRTRPDDGASPVTTISREKIDRAGATGVGEITSNLTATSFTTEAQFQQGAGQAVQLRGLGLGSTLVLINGRRTVTSALTNSNNFFDLNTIPLAAVERIELLSDSASAVYGADATGGVVNVVLSRAVERPTLDFYYGGADGGATEKRASFSMGTSGPDFRASLALDYFKRENLPGRERDLFANRDYRRFGGRDQSSLIANPGNICTVSGANLPGLSAPCAAVPAGSTGIGLTPASFAATAGQQNRTSSYNYLSVVPESERKSAVGLLEWDVASDVTLFAETMYSDRRDRSSQSPPQLSNATVPASNPFNPFGVAVTANFLLASLSDQSIDFSSESLRLVTGARGKLGAWDWELAGLRFRDRGNQDYGQLLDGAAVNAALASASPETALNVFQDGPGGSDALVRSLLNPTPRLLIARSNADQIDGFARGPLLDLPAGAVQAVIGGEWRRESVNYDFSAINYSIPSDRNGRESHAAFAEIQIPLLAGDASKGDAGRLTLSSAGRYDHYSDFGGTWNPQVGIVWQATPYLMLRGSYGTAFQAPSLYNLYLAETSFSTQTVDPSRNNQTVPILSRGGGNPNLKPQTAESWTIGFVLAPQRSNLRVRGSFWQIVQEDRFQRLAAPVILANESSFSDYIVRDAPTPADIAAGLPGVLREVRSVTLNFGRLKTNGFDADVAMSWDTDLGRLSADVAGTLVTTYRTADVPGGAPVDRVGIANTNGTIPRFKATATGVWDPGPFGLTVTGRYISGYDDTTADIRNGLRVPSQIFVDAQVSVHLGELIGGSWAENSELRFGAKNLFNRTPDYSGVWGIGYDPSIADLRERFLYVGLSKAF